MKTTILITILLLTQLAYSQDIITTKKGDDIKSKVTEIGQEEIKYKKFENQDGPTYSILKSEILMIRYANGSKDLFSNEASAAKPQLVNKTNQTQTNSPKYNFSGLWEYQLNGLSQILMDISADGNGYLIKQYLSKENYMNEVFSTIKVLDYLDDNNNPVMNTYRSDYNKFTLLNDSAFELTSKSTYTSYKYKRINPKELSVLKEEENKEKGYAFRSRNNITGIQGNYYGVGSYGLISYDIYKEGRINKSDLGIGLNFGNYLSTGAGNSSYHFSLGLAANYHIPIKINFFDTFIGVRGDYMWGQTVGFNYYVGSRLYLSKKFGFTGTYFGRGSSFYWGILFIQ